MTTETPQKEALEPLATAEPPKMGLEPEVAPSQNKAREQLATVEFRGGTAYVGLHDAMRLTGASKSTISRYSTSGKLSFELNGDGNRTYQVVELERVFGKLKRVGDPETVPDEEPSDGLQPDEPDHEITLKLALLEAENQRLRDNLEAEQEKARLLAQNADDWKEQCQRMTLMLTHRPEPQPAAPARRGILSRILGGGSR